MDTKNSRQEKVIGFYPISCIRYNRNRNNLKEIQHNENMKIGKNYEFRICSLIWSEKQVSAYHIV